MATLDLTSHNYQPNNVVPLREEENVLETPTDSFHKQVYQLDTDMLQEWEIVYQNISKARRDLIRAHWEGQSGPYSSFTLTPPSYINSGNNITVKYMKGGYLEEPIINTNGQGWNVTLRVEKWYA